MSRSLRLPLELDAELKRLAKKNSRSEHGEILYALQQYVKAEQEKEKQFSESSQTHLKSP